jgi:hypothetical protein
MSIVGDVDEHSAAGNTLSTNIADNFNLVKALGFLQDVLTGERQDSRPRPLVYVSSHIHKSR